MELSIIIPSLRPTVLKETIERIYATTSDLDYEILIVSHLDMLEISKLDRVVMVKETEQKGSNWAIELGTNVAQGTYIMELSDDNLIDTDCLKNIVDFMKQNDDKLIVCGPRVHDLWEVHPETTVYGFYYPKTPCIKKSNLEKIGQFYDTSFHSYFADPDLALRVIAKGGIVTICPDAWIEFHNIKKDFVGDDRKQYFEQDSKLFLERWKVDFGHKVSNPDRPDIVNLGGIQMFQDGELPFEYCSRLFHYLKINDWTMVADGLNKDYICSSYLLPDLLVYILLYSQYIPSKLYEELLDTIKLKLSKKKHELNIIDVVYLLTEIRDSNKVKRLFNDLGRYRSFSRQQAINKATEANQIVKEYGC